MHRQWRNATNNYVLLIENKGSGMPLIQDLRRDNIGQERFLRLHPHDQPRRHRPLPANAGWCEGRGPVIALTEKIFLALQAPSFVRPGRHYIPSPRQRLPKSCATSVLLRIGAQMLTNRSAV